MQSEAGASCRHRKHGAMVPLLPEEETLEIFPVQPIPMLPPTLSASSVSPSSSPLSSPSSGFSSTSSSSSALPSSSSPSSRASRSSSSLPQRRSSSSERRLRSRPTREWPSPWLSKPFSEPAIPSLQESLAREAASKECFMEPHPEYRRCMTDTDFRTVQGMPSQAVPDLLQLFNIFQFNTPVKPPARMLVNVTLVGNIQSVRLLVEYDASVQDVIKASLKGYVKEGRLPRHCVKSQNYGLHYSPFCLESIDPTELISSLGTRSFFLFPRVDQLSNLAQNPKGGKPWWDILSLLSS